MWMALNPPVDRYRYFFSWLKCPSHPNFFFPWMTHCVVQKASRPTLLPTKRQTCSSSPKDFLRQKVDLQRPTHKQTNKRSYMYNNAPATNSLIDKLLQQNSPFHDLLEHLQLPALELTPADFWALLRQSNVPKHYSTKQATHKKMWFISAWQISLQHQQITISLLAQFYVAHSL